MLRSRERFHGGLLCFPQTESPVGGELLGRETQHYSHFTLKAEIWRVDSLPEALGSRALYLTPDRIDEAPLGGIDRKIFSVYIR